MNILSITFEAVRFFPLLVEPKVVRNKVKTQFLLRKAFVLFLL